MFTKYIKNNLSLFTLTSYLFIYYFFIRILYTYYSVEFQIDILFYRIGFYLPLLIWIILIVKDTKISIFQNIHVKLFLSLFTYQVLIILFQQLYGANYINTSVQFFQIKVFVYSIFNILLGYYSYKLIYSNSNKNIFITTFLLYSLLLLMNISNFSLDTNGFSGIHLLLGDTFIVVSLLGIFSKDFNKLIKISLVSISLLIVFIIHSRASFYSYVVVYLFFIIKEVGFKYFIYLSLTFIIGFFTLYFIDILSIDKRMSGVFQGKQDASLDERLLQFQYGLYAIKQYWFFGEYSGHVVAHATGYKSGSMGCYMHNWLSYWRQYGLLYFILFSSLYLYGLFIVFKDWLYNNSKPVNLIFYIALFVGVELLLFRSYSDTLVWFVFALMYSYMNEHKKGTKCLK